MVLFEELLLDSDVVIGDAEDNETVLGLAALLRQSRHGALTSLLLDILLGGLESTLRNF